MYCMYISPNAVQRPPTSLGTGNMPRRRRAICDDHIYVCTYCGTFLSHVHAYVPTDYTVHSQVLIADPGPVADDALALSVYWVA